MKKLIAVLLMVFLLSSPAFAGWSDLIFTQDDKDDIGTGTGGSTDPDDLNGDTIDDNKVDVAIIPTAPPSDGDTTHLSTADQIRDYVVGLAFAGVFTNLTDFDTQTAWRVFYSNGDGDTTELALGADGTYLKSNGASAAPTFATPTDTKTALSVGTKTATTLAITSDGDTDDVVLPEADTDYAGLLGADKWDEIVANSSARHADESAASTTTAGINNGTDLSANVIFAFDDDVDGETRDDWDIGCDEYVSGEPPAARRRIIMVQ